MPRFKTNQDIFQYKTEFFDENWMDSDKLITPKTSNWDYSRELKVEDVDAWEVVYEKSSLLSVYAAWIPYAEFYLIKFNDNLNSLGFSDEFYYGNSASELVKNRVAEFGISLKENYIWVEENTFDKFINSSEKTIYIP